MSRVKRPLNMAAVSAADEAMYAKYENEPRPNALYNADGTRKKLSGTDPQQEDLRREWIAFYAANGGELEFTLSTTPNTTWGSSPGDAPPSFK